MYDKGRYSPSPGAGLQFTFRKLSILLVDSMPSAMDTQEDYLAPLELYRIWTAKKPDEAMSTLDERQVHAVVTAAKMQPISGLQLVEMIRKHPKHKDLPVILIADQVDNLLQEKALGLKVHQVLSQPLKGDDFREAVRKALEPLVDHKEEEFMTHMDAARRASRKEQWETAEEAYRAALGVKMDEEAYNGLAKVLSAKGDAVGAGRCFMAAIKANPLSLKAFLGLANIYVAKDRLPDALKILSRAVDAAKKLKEGSALKASIMFYMGELELRLNDLKMALGLFEQASETSPEDAKLQVQIGDSLAEAGHHQESEAFYSKALEMDPELAHVYNRLAIAYRRQEKYDMAIDLYKKALAFHPDDENLMYNTARCYWEMGELQHSMEMLGKAMAVNPDFEAAARLLDVVMRQWEKATGSKVVPPDDKPADPAGV